MAFSFFLSNPVSWPQPTPTPIPCLIQSQTHGSVMEEEVGLVAQRVSACTQTCFGAHQ